MSNQIHKKIEKIFNDDIQLHMVWLDGDWGSGKTYFAKESLLKDLKEFKPLYISTIGVDNINQFRDKLISKYYLSQDLTSNEFSGIANLVTKSLSNISTDNSSAIISIVQGFGGAIKERAISSMNNVTIIVDDVERIINEKTLKGVLGECLNMCESNKNVRILVLSDTSKIETKRVGLEKYIPNKIKFKLSKKEQFNICFKDRNFFSEYMDEIEENQSIYELNNLRVLKKVAAKLACFYSELKQDPQLDIPQNMNYLIKDVFRVIHCHYIKGKTVEEIDEGLKLQSLRYTKIPDDDPELKAKMKEFKMYYSYDAPSLEFIQYCCDAKEFESTFILYEPKFIKEAVNDIIYNEIWNIEESSFHLLIEELKNLIFLKETPEINKWFEACETFIKLIEMEAIEYDKDKFISEIEKLLESKHFSVLNSNYKPRKPLTTDKLRELYDEKSEKIKTFSRHLDIEKIIYNARVSWSNVDSETFQNYKYKQLFFMADSDKWKNLISNWCPKSIGDFSHFLYDRNIAEAHGFIEQEGPVLKHILIHVNEIYKMQPYGQRRSALKELILNLSKVTK